MVSGLLLALFLVYFGRYFWTLAGELWGIPFLLLLKLGLGKLENVQKRHKI